MGNIMLCDFQTDKTPIYKKNEAFVATPGTENMPTAVCIDDIERSTAHKYTFLSETSKRTDGVPFSEELSNDELEIYEGAKLCPTQQEISYRRRLDGVLTSMFDKVEKLKKGSGETVKGGEYRRFQSVQSKAKC
ncbi:hypothetical protein TELCIR_16372 [Teladorsagia circumcincta]|uniref:Uncharacterized protein n=1 Tax=Teladorsagia circumcincta TaxID=45464 RepID=A0A2G9TVN0_TELCI|nr:hypothetical protein TELCIR_16372 [Teladorsagia circumcincta]